MLSRTSVAPPRPCFSQYLNRPLGQFSPVMTSQFPSYLGVVHSFRKISTTPTQKGDGGIAAGLSTRSGWWLTTRKWYCWLSPRQIQNFITFSDCRGGGMPF